MTDSPSKELIQEEVFSSDEEFDDEEGADTESDSDVDARLAEDDVFDIEFFKCYSALKKKDGKIYDKDVKFFAEEVPSDDEEKKGGGNEDDGKTTRRDKSKAPKMTLLDHQLNLKEDEIEDYEFRRPKIDLNEPVSKSYYEKELEEIKRSIEKVSENVDSESDDDLLVVKGSKTAADPSKPRKIIDKMLDKLEGDEEEEISHLKQIWSDPAKLTEEDKFLRDYILNKRYMPANPEEHASGKPTFFSKNLDELSDVDEEGEEEVITKKHKVDHRSDEKDFDKISRIPRNSTKTIRDLVEKREKKEKRLKSMEKIKKKKRALKDADCEDLVGDLPTKFHYRETEANDYGLSAEELLMATDEELEKWVSLKDAIRYKTRDEELAQKKKFEQKRHDLDLKKQIFQSIYGDDKASNDKSLTKMLPNNDKSNKGKKRKRVNSGGSHDDQEEKINPIEDIEVKPVDSKKNKKKRKRGLGHKKFVKKTGVAPDRLLAYGLSKTKLKKSRLL